MIRCASPRCCECAHPLSVVEPFVLAVAQHHRCEGCGVHLRVHRDTAASWVVATAAERTGARCAPLPAVAAPALRNRFFAACRKVAQLLQPCEGVEPGESSLKDEAA